MFGWLKRERSGKGRVAEAADGEWEVVSAARQQESRDGQVLEYPGRTARCPLGHTRMIPTRFDKPVVELTCVVCNRKYALRT